MHVGSCMQALYELPLSPCAPSGPREDQALRPLYFAVLQPEAAPAAPAVPAAAGEPHAPSGPPRCDAQPPTVPSQDVGNVDHGARVGGLPAA